ncbi:alpha/beta hydrolase [Chitinophagaceae bacterium MMS25-I14]
MRLSILLLLLLSLSARSQSAYEYFNGDAFWQKMELETVQTPLPVFQRTDTVIVMATTRRMNPGTLRYMAEVKDKGNKPRYFVIYTSGGKWKVHPFASLETALNVVPDVNRDWVVYTEGMGKIFTNDADRGMQMSAQYGANVLLLDYPSIRTGYKLFGSIRNYKFALRNANNAYKDFMPVLDTVQVLHNTRRMGRGHVTLFFHSMGNNVMRKIAQHDDINRYNNMKWADNIILNAPCVPRKKHAKWVDRIHFANNIYVHYNPHDGTLKWARLAGFRQIMGEHIKKPVSTNATYINFWPLCGEGHSNFLSLYSREDVKPQAFTHYRQVLHGYSANLNDKNLYQPSSYRHIGWELVSNGQAEKKHHGKHKRKHM